LGPPGPVADDDPGPVEVPVPGRLAPPVLGPLTSTIGTSTGPLLPRPPVPPHPMIIAS
jgi:hypothetical protein